MRLFQNMYRNYIEPIRTFNRPARLFLWMTVIDGVIISSWWLFFNFYILESGHSRDFLGLANSMPSIAGLLLGIPIGRLSDRIGRKPAILLGIGGATVMMLVQLTTRQPFVLLAAAFLTGAFNMLFIVSQAPLMVKLADSQNRTLLFSLNYGLSTISGAVGNLFAGQLPALFGTILHVQATSATAYQAVLITAVSLGTTAMIPMWLMREPDTRQTAPGPAVAEAGHSSGLVRTTVKMATPNVLIGFGAAILIPYMNVFFKDQFVISDKLLGTMFSLSSLMIGVGSLIGPRLAVRLGGKVRAVTLTQFSSLVFLMLIGFSPFYWLAAIGFLMRTMLMNMATPLYSAFCMERVPERDQGVVNSVLNISWQVGWSVGPYISGLVQENYGFAPLFLATGGLYLVAILTMWTFFQKAERTLQAVLV
ncbi:MAG: MFS transporter [Anaerolineales bacterium]|nr:MFS transporter [Anaerolineales bacterium]